MSKTYTHDQQMKDLLLCESFVFPVQSSKETSRLADSGCTRAKHDYDILDLSADSSYTFFTPAGWDSVG